MKNKVPLAGLVTASLLLSVNTAAYANDFLGTSFPVSQASRDAYSGDGYGSQRPLVVLPELFGELGESDLVGSDRAYHLATHRRRRRHAPHYDSAIPTEIDGKSLQERQEAQFDQGTSDSHAREAALQERQELLAANQLQPGEASELEHTLMQSYLPEPYREDALVPRVPGEVFIGEPEPADDWDDVDVAYRVSIPLLRRAAFRLGFTRGFVQRQQAEMSDTLERLQDVLASMPAVDLIEISEIIITDWRLEPLFDSPKLTRAAGFASGTRIVVRYDYLGAIPHESAHVSAYSGPSPPYHRTVPVEPKAELVPPGWAAAMLNDNNRITTYEGNGSPHTVAVEDYARAREIYLATDGGRREAEVRYEDKDAPSFRDTFSARWAFLDEHYGVTTPVELENNGRR